MRLLIPIIFPIFAPLIVQAEGRVFDPGVPDTVFVESSSFPADITNFEVRVNFFNDEELGGFDIPLVWDSPDISCDSIEWDNSRAGYIGFKLSEINNVCKCIHAAAIIMYEEDIPPGSGIAFTAYFSVIPDADDQVITFDSSKYGDAGDFRFTNSDGSHFVPQFNKGFITIGNPPTTMIDTFWIVAESSMNNIVNHYPKFAWDYTDSIVQTSLEIEVGSDEDWQDAEMWNPEIFISSDTFKVYDGETLVDGSEYYVRLRLNDGSNWFDWCTTSFRMNSVPEAPALSSPPDGTIVETTTPSLYVLNSYDAEGDDLFYDIFVEVDCVLYAGFNIPQQIDSTGWQVDPPLFDDRFYPWWARAYDGYEYSDWSEFWIFWVNAIEEPPSPFYLCWPPDTDWAQVHVFPTPFWWSMSHDYDPFDSVYYRLEVAIDSEFTFVATYDSIYQTVDTVPDLTYGTHYWWKVTAVDTKGNETRSDGIGDFMTWILGDVNHDFAANIGDAVFLINYIFKFGDPPIQPKAGDCNGDCCVNVGDAVYMINYVLRNGPPPLVGCDDCR